MKPTRTLPTRPPRWWKAALAAGAGALWLAFTVLAVVPVVRSAVTGQRELGETGRRIADLDGWTGPRLQMARDLAEAGPAFEAAWSRMFPAERDREGLFLELARIADASGVDDFDLAEVLDLDFGDEPDDGYDDDYVDEDGDGYEDEAAPAGPDAVALETYRVRASWFGDFRRTADFLARLRSVPRALSVVDLSVQPHLDGVRVDLDLEVYVDGAS